MDMQPDLFGTPAPAAAWPQHRTYFAVLPPPRMAQNLERLAKSFGRLHNVRRVVRAERLHVSLAGLACGAAPAPETLEDALAMGEAVRVPSFELCFDRLETWNGGRVRPGRPREPTVLACSAPPREADALHDALRRQLQLFGRKAGRRQFNPHLTLWYAPASIAPRRLARPLRLRVERFWLVHTVTGGQLEAIASWPLKF